MQLWFWSTTQLQVCGMWTLLSICCANEKHVCRWTHLWDHCASSSGLGSSQCDVEKEKPAKDVARDSQDNKSQAMTQSRQSGLSTIFQFLFLMHTPQINNKASWDLMSQEVKFAPLVILVTIPPLAYDDNALIMQLINCFLGRIFIKV